MKKQREVTIRTKELDYVMCNLCGGEVKKDAFGHFEEYLSIEKQWGYGSEYDGETHNIDICHECYKKFLATLEIPPVF